MTLHRIRKPGSYRPPHLQRVAQQVGQLSFSISGRPNLLEGVAEDHHLRLSPQPVQKLSGSRQRVNAGGWCSECPSAPVHAGAECRCASAISCHSPALVTGGAPQLGIPLPSSAKSDPDLRHRTPSISKQTMFIVRSFQAPHDLCQHMSPASALSMTSRWRTVRPCKPVRFLGTSVPVSPVQPLHHSELVARRSRPPAPPAPPPGTCRVMPWKRTTTRAVTPAAPALPPTTHRRVGVAEIVLLPQPTDDLRRPGIVAAGTVELRLQALNSRGDT